jgi:hypothetical protein
MQVLRPFLQPPAGPTWAEAQLQAAAGAAAAAAAAATAAAAAATAAAAAGWVVWYEQTGQDRKCPLIRAREPQQIS